MKVKQNPNILFVFSDQHRWCDLGSYGNTQVVSPNLDAFAQKAIRFNNCISNSPVCVPARGSMLTGLFPLRHGAVSNDLAMRKDVESIAHVLVREGYRTGYIGKWHLAGIPRDQYIPEGKGRFGFQEWKVANCCHNYLNSYYYDEENNRVDIDGYEPIEQTNMAVDYIHRNSGKKPWCLVLSWAPPHDPYQHVPQKYLDMYRDMDIELRPNVPEVIHAGSGRIMNREDIMQNYRGYYAHITALDEQFGRLIAALEEAGEIDNTIIVYTSDHGDMLGSQGTTNKQWAYEESIKVPLIVYWKGRTIHTSTDELIGLVDLPVSLLGLLGLRFSGEVDGKDLHELFINPEAKGLEECYIFDPIPCHQAFARGSSEWRGIRTRRYTYARTASDEGYMLYDNLEDPYQMINQINDPDYDQIKGDLREKLDGYIQKHDKLLPWQDFIKEFGLKDEWNRSQAYFKLPLLE